MRNKWKDGGGFTLVETLCAVSVLVLLCLMLGTGMQAVLNTYRTVTAKSEMQLLLNTLVNAIAGELRYAQGTGEDGGGNLTYNDGLSLTISGGRVLSGGRDLVPRDRDGKGGAYHGGTYQAGEIEGRALLSYDSETGCFTLNLKVTWKDGPVSVQTPEGGVVIRCLNPPEEPEEGGETP